MLGTILGEKIALYIRRHTPLVISALVLTTVSSFLRVIPAFLISPFVDKGMQIDSGPITWKIPWIEINPGSWFSWHTTELVVAKNMPQNTFLILLAFIAFSSVLLMSI
jgi:ABC-type multidrug transport system fused ATPase/permease subunit